MKLTNEELLKIALSEKVPLKTKFSGNEVFRFIDAIGIKDGKREVKPRFIYQAYKAWSAKPLLLKDFINEFNKVFTANGNYNTRCYSLNLRPLELLNKVDKLKR
jgi:hypothetical protein